MHQRGQALERVKVIAVITIIAMPMVVCLKLEAAICSCQKRLLEACSPCVSNCACQLPSLELPGSVC